MNLRDLYDADKRVTDAQVAHAATHMVIPHPLCGTEYADGMTNTCSKLTCNRCQKIRRARVQATFGWKGTN